MRVAETQTSASTNAGGCFSLEAALAEGEYTLLISFVGYQPARRDFTVETGQAEVAIEDVPLQPSVLEADEVVVTGTGGPVRSRELGNSLATLDAEELQGASPSSIDRALQGKIAGVNVSQNSGDPGGGMSVRLRGASTVLGSAQPLYIVDGVIVNNDSPELLDLGSGIAGGGAQNRLADFNPNDIERIEVVKGAAAAALYGSRANNGVVQIFTKRGREGTLRVTYTARALTEAVRQTLDVNDAEFDAPPGIEDRQRVERYDFQDYIFRRAYGTEQYVSVSGGSEDTRFVTSGSYYTNQGVVRGDDFQRVNARARIDQDVSDWLSLSAGAKFASTSSNEIPNGGITANYGALTGFIFGPNTVDPRPDAQGSYPQGTTLANPVEVIDRFDFEQETQRFIGSLQANLSPVDGLSVDYTLGLDTYDQVGTAFIPPGTSAPQQPTGFARRAEQGVLQLNHDLSARYEADFFDGGLASTTLVGGTLQYEETELFNGESQQLSPIVRVVQSGVAARDFGETRTERTIYGVFAQETFGVADRLFLTAAGRLDASSAFGEGEHWQFYPKASASYLVSEENFWQDARFSDTFSRLKLRAAVGASGGLTAIGAFDRFTSYAADPYVSAPGLQRPAQLGTRDLSPERQREYEVGFDAGFFDGRLSLETTYYNQYTTNLLLRRSLAPTTGFLDRLENVGTLTNRGIEVLVQAVPVQRERFRWNTTFTYDRNRNEVDGLEEDVLIFPGSFGAVGAANGEALGIYYNSAFARNDAGQVVDQAGNALVEDGDGYWRLAEGEIGPDAPAGTGLPASADGDQIIGTPLPDWTASWINELTLRDNLTFHLQLDAVVGQDVFNFTRRLGSLGAFGTLDDYERELEGDLPAGYNASVFNIFENWVEDGSFLKVREASLRYTFYPENLPFGAGSIESIAVEAAGRNLFSFDDYSGYDPEINVAGQSTTVRGFDFVEVPIPRTFSLSATLNF